MSIPRLVILLSSAVLAACGGGGGGSSGPSGGVTPDVTDTSAPQVTSVSPANGTTRVPLGSNVIVVFNEPIIAVTGEVGVQVTGPSGSVSGTAHYDSASLSVTFSPTNPFTEYTQYQVMVINIADPAGNLNKQVYSGSFTSLDITSPVTSASEVTGIYNRDLSVSLSCSDTGGSGCATTYYSVDGSTPSLGYNGPVTIGEGTTTLRFYSVDNDGQVEIEQAITYTVDLTPPSVSAVSPQSGAANVAMDATVPVTFSEPIDVSTLVNGSITLNNGMGGEISYDSTTNTATFVPSALLKCNTTYTGTVTGVADLATNVMTANYSWSFSTVNDCSAPMTTASPDGGVIRGSSVSVTLACDDSMNSPSTGCARIAYTTNGTTPSFDPPNGTIVSGNIAGPITLGIGETKLKFAAEDNAGNIEIVRSKHFAVSNNGYLYVAEDNGLYRGIGQVPGTFIALVGGIGTDKVFRDAITSRLYAVDANELYTSDDDGMSWSNECCSNSNVMDIYAAGSQVYLGTGSGLLVSRDGLRTFSLRTTSAGLNSNVVNELNVSDNRVCVRTGTNSIAVSDDYGMTFTSHNFGIDGAYALFVDGINVYVGGMNGLYISTDGGITFATPKTTANGLGSNVVNDIHAVGNYIYLATNGGISTSVDGGVTFKNVTVTGGSPQAVYANGSYVYASAYNSYNPSVGGVSIAPVSATGNLFFSAPKAQINGLRDNNVREMSGGPSGEVYFSTMGGLSVSYDNGTTFFNNGLGGGSKRDVLASGNLLYVATQYGFSISTDGGHRFVTRTKRDGLGDNNTRNVITHSGSIYVGTTAGLSISPDGLTFTNKSAADGIGSATNPWINDLSSNGTNLYIATQDGLVVPSSKGSTPYVTLTTADGLVSSSISGVHVDNGIVYVATGSGLNISTDNTATWQLRTRSDGLVNNLLYDVYAYGNYIHVAGAGSVSISTDGGASFTENSAHAAVGTGPSSYVSGFNNYVYIADFSNLEISDDNGMTFVLRDNSSGLPSTGYLWGVSYAP